MVLYHLNIISEELRINPIPFFPLHIKCIQRKPSLSLCVSFVFLHLLFSLWQVQHTLLVSPLALLPSHIRHVVASPGYALFTKHLSWLWLA